MKLNFSYFLGIGLQGIIFYVVLMTLEKETFLGSL